MYYTTAATLGVQYGVTISISGASGLLSNTRQGTQISTFFDLEHG
jgi:hypothetical protein